MIAARAVALMRTKVNLPARGATNQPRSGIVRCADIDVLPIVRFGASIAATASG
jgi:hypothetical protein